MAETTIEKTPPKSKKPPKAGPGRPTHAQAQEFKDKNQNVFFQAVNSVAEADWGTRSLIWLYRLEPFTDRRKSGDAVYLMQYQHPVDENKVMTDFGSGRYRLMLTMRKPGADRGDEINRFEFEINNPAHPPKIPAGEWVDDPRNIKWAWAKPFLQSIPNGMQQQPQQPAQNGSSTLFETVHAMTAMQESADRRAEMVTEAVLAARPEGNSIDDAVKIVSLLKGGGETELMKMMGAQLERAMNRVEKLEDERRQAGNAAPPQPKTLAEQIKELVEIKTGLGNFFGSNGEKTEGAAAVATRSRMAGWMEFVQPWIPEAISLLKPFSAVLAQRMMMNAQQAQQRPQAPQPSPPPAQIAAPANGTQPPPQPQPATPPTLSPQEQAMQAMIDFINAITPRMLNHLVQGIDGGTFATWVADGYSIDRVQQMQMQTPAMVVEFYKQTPYWSQLADREASFLKFLEEFNAWKPEDPEEQTGDEDEREEIG